MEQREVQAAVKAALEEQGLETGWTEDDPEHYEEVSLFANVAGVDVQIDVRNTIDGELAGSYSVFAFEQESGDMVAFGEPQPDLETALATTKCDELRARIPQSE